MACKKNIDPVQLIEEEMDYTEESPNIKAECCEDSMNHEEQMNETRDDNNIHVVDNNDDFNEDSDISEHNEEDEFWECDEPCHKKGKVGKCCEKQRAVALKNRLIKLVEECKKLKEIMLEKLLQLSKVLVEYERSQSSRYLYIPDEKPNLKTIEKIAGNIFPEFRRLERNLQVVSKLFKDCKFDDI